MENKNSTKHPSAYKIISIVVIVILAILFTFPLYWIITGSFKTNAAINSTTPIWWPKEWTLANYQKLFSRQTAPLFQFNIPFSSLITGSRDLKLTLTGPTVPAAVRWLINTVFMAIMSMIRDRRSERMGNLLIQNCILSSGCNWFRSSYRCMEVDV